MSKLDLSPPTADPITFYRGDTEVLTFRIYQRSTRTLQDLTGVTALMQLRPSRNSETLLYTFDLTVNEETSEIVMLGGIVETLVQGTVSVVGDISNV